MLTFSKQSVYNADVESTKLIHMIYIKNNVLFDPP